MFSHSVSQLDTVLSTCLSHFSNSQASLWHLCKPKFCATKTSLQRPVGDITGPTSLFFYGSVLKLLKPPIVRWSSSQQNTDLRPLLTWQNQHMHNSYPCRSSIRARASPESQLLYSHFHLLRPHEKGGDFVLEGREEVRQWFETK